MKTPSTWEPPSKCPMLSETLTAMHNDMPSKFAVAVTKFKPQSNLDVMDRLGLWWLQVIGFVVVKHDEGHSLIQMRRDFKLETTVALASDPTQFALQQPDRLGVFLAVKGCQ